MGGGGRGLVDSGGDMHARAVLARRKRGRKGPRRHNRRAGRPKEGTRKRWTVQRGRRARGVPGSGVSGCLQPGVWEAHALFCPRPARATSTGIEAARLMTVVERAVRGRLFELGGRAREYRGRRHDKAAAGVGGGVGVTWRR